MAGAAGEISRASWLVKLSDSGLGASFPRTMKEGHHGVRARLMNQDREFNRLFLPASAELVMQGQDPMLCPLKAAFPRNGIQAPMQLSIPFTLEHAVTKKLGQIQTERIIHCPPFFIIAPSGTAFAAHFYLNFSFFLILNCL
jgi:hypothetical protein